MDLFKTYFTKTLKQFQIWDKQNENNDQYSVPLEILYAAKEAGLDSQLHFATSMTDLTASLVVGEKLEVSDPAIRIEIDKSPPELQRYAGIHDAIQIGTNSAYFREVVRRENTISRSIEIMERFRDGDIPFKIL